MPELDTRVMEMASWLRPQANWQTNDTLQMLKLGIDQQQQEQQMALALREMALREQSQSILSEMRLSKMEEDQAEAADMPALQAYANNPGMGVPAFKSPKSYQKLQAIDLQRSRSELGKQQAADMADFNRRLAKVDARDRFAISEAMRKGAPAAEVWDALAAAETKSTAVAPAGMTPTTVRIPRPGGGFDTYSAPRPSMTLEQYRLREFAKRKEAYVTAPDKARRQMKDADILKEIDTEYNAMVTARQPAPAAATTAAAPAGQFRVGQRAIQGGVMYEFNGLDWVEVK